jgi:uncharacterized membrane protein YhhN
MAVKKYLYWIVAVGEIIALAADVSWLHQICKPLLMITLMIYFWDRSDKRKDERWVKYVTLALVFSWIGDIMLLFTDKHFMYFLAGLSGFLAAHVVYLLAYIRATHRNRIQLEDSAVPLLIVEYGIVLLYVILPYLSGVLQVPVLLYSIILMAMGVFAWYRKGETNVESFRWVFFGALLFIVSDSILAINRFSQTIPYASLLVMITYILAQFLIVNGLLKHKQAL